jgi:hypothetical protein
MARARHRIEMEYGKSVAVYRLAEAPHRGPALPNTYAKMHSCGDSGIRSHDGQIPAVVHPVGFVNY